MARRQERCAQLAGRAPACARDLADVARRQLRLVRPRGEDERPPRDLLRPEAERRSCLDEETVEAHAQARLLERLALCACREVLARLHAAAGRAPDALGEVRLADE